MASYRSQINKQLNVAVATRKVADLEAAFLSGCARLLTGAEEMGFGRNKAKKLVQQVLRCDDLAEAATLIKQFNIDTGSRYSELQYRTLEHCITETVAAKIPWAIEAAHSQTVLTQLTNG